MQQPIVIALAFTLFGSCWTFGQEIKADSLSANPAGFEGKDAGDRKELVPGIFFRWCPAGTFTMGSPAIEPGRSAEEDQVSVTLTKGYWLGETEVTQRQWQTLMGTTPWKGWPHVKEDNKSAASYVSYEEVVEYCKKLTNQEREAGKVPRGWKYSLPTEAQWEYACRAGTTTMYSFGSDESDLSEYGWWGGILGNGNAKAEQFAHPVGQKKSNAWGFKDMHGNVWEWCRDGYTKTLVGGRDPEGSTSGPHRVFRGGGWSDFAVACRSAFRSGYSPDFRAYHVGFRLAILRD